jgi:hypothetical protein
MRARLQRKQLDAIATEWNTFDDHPLVKRFPANRLAPKPLAILSCCGRHYNEHGHMAEHVVCPGMWILEDPHDRIPPEPAKKDDVLGDYDVIEVMEE